MKFDIRSRWTGNIKFSAEIDCAEDTPMRIKIGLAVKWANKNDAVLRGADLRDAVLSGADLRDADLRDAVLSDAVLSGADLRDAVLSGADLRDADLRDAVLSDAVLRGADLRDAVLSGADLSGAVLRDAVLSDADLSGAVLRGADLRGAVLSGADLRDAVLRDAVLSDADLSGADLSGADLSGAVLSGDEIPVIPHIDAAILASIEANKATGQNGLKMDGWHGGNCDETNWCQTTHCRAGYAICLAGKAGFALEAKFGPAAAGALIYAKSRPGKPVPDFYDSNEGAMADIVACAAEQSA